MYHVHSKPRYSLKGSYFFRNIIVVRPRTVIREIDYSYFVVSESNIPWAIIAGPVRIGRSNQETTVCQVYSVRLIQVGNCGLLISIGNNSCYLGIFSQFFNQSGWNSERIPDKHPVIISEFFHITYNSCGRISFYKSQCNFMFVCRLFGSHNMFQPVVGIGKLCKCICSD